MFGWQFQGIARFASSSSQPISHGACDHPKHKLYATRSEIRESFSEDEIKLDLFSIIESLFYDLLSNCSPFVSDEWERQINWRLISTRSRSNFRRIYKVSEDFSNLEHEFTNVSSNKLRKEMKCRRLEKLLTTVMCSSSRGVLFLGSQEINISYQVLLTLSHSMPRASVKAMRSGTVSKQINVNFNSLCLCR